MKYKNFFIIPALVASIGVPGSISAKENVGGSKAATALPTVNAACVEATAQSDLTVNNVRCRILMGDLWWNPNDNSRGIYEIPKGSGLNSIYSGALWIGGVDAGGQLVVAAQTYRQTGNDFWPGPLDTTTASIDQDVCNTYDKHFRITRKEVETFVSTGVSTAAINNWPGNGDLAANQAKYLAPFFDADADGIYKPSAGDYPGYDLVSGDGYGECQVNQCIPVDQLFGDETIWWVFNDKGNIHGESEGKPIGLEIRAQAFGFFTDDEINNMTFYNYRIFNRSASAQIDSCYFGVWADSDLGEATDDYVGCDVERGLGYTYNSDDDDAPPTGYGANPPALGIDFFRGPIADAGDAKDNDRDCQTDETCEQIVMSGFLYYDNTNNVPYGNPDGATHFYNYLKMKWGDGTSVLYNGANGYGGTGPVAQFMYPGNPTTDKHDWGIGGNCSTSPTLPGWDEVTALNAPQDRRMLQSAGPFTLLPGAVNVITTGVVWARATSGGPLASVKLMQVADDKAQALFDNCFKVLDGPTAPDMTIQELDKALILYLTNTDPNSNNYNETYTEFDPLISLVDSAGNACPKANKYYNFEGYKVYQLRSSTVSSGNLEDPNDARLIFQSDIKNGVSRLINYEFDQSLGAGIPKEKVDGADKGLSHSIKVTTDAFTSGPLINHKPYYFMAVAYGYNEFKKYQQDIPATDGTMCDASVAAVTGQKKPYKQGRKNLVNYSAIPHISTSYTGGTEIHGDYGNGPQITRIEGHGNGGRVLDFTAGTVSAILASSDHRTKTPTYDYGKGPIDVRVVDPLNVPDGHTFTLKFDTTLILSYNTLATGVFEIGETVTGSTSGAQGVITGIYVDTVNAAAGVLQLKNIVGIFTTGETITGNASASTAKSIARSINQSTWSLKNNTTGQTVNSDKAIIGVNEQLFMNWGLSISIVQISDPGSSTSANNGFLTASMTFADPSKNWLTALADRDGPYYANWIRSGTVVNISTFQNDEVNADNDQVYEGVLGGTWAPYRVVAATSTGASFDNSKHYTGPGLKAGLLSNTLISELASVDVVLTSDKSKWTRSVVLELCEDSTWSANTAGVSKKARKLDFRRALSVDKNGSTATGTDNNDYPTGMGWFPGYAINLETGERLNIAFGENSALVNENGNDMKWNPTTNQTASSYNLPWDSVGQSFGSPVFGGQHYIYVFGHNKDNDVPGSPTPNDFVNIPRYDKCKAIRDILGLNDGLPLESPSGKEKVEIFKDAMWVNIPLLRTSHSLLETDVTIRLRVAKSYKHGYSAAYVKDGFKNIFTDTATIAQNRNLPMYTFTTEGIATHTGENELAVEALDLIRAVPNPYYAYSNYERNTLDNRVKITNLPEVCTVSIYNLSGTLIRKYKKGEAVTNHAAFASGITETSAGVAITTWDGSIDWDLKNTVSVPISSGVYIIHVEVPGVGEKVVKWFGVMRPIDLDSF